MSNIVDFLNPDLAKVKLIDGIEKPGTVIFHMHDGQTIKYRVTPTRSMRLNFAVTVNGFSFWSKIVRDDERDQLADFFTKMFGLAQACRQVNMESAYQYGQDFF